MTEKEQKDRIEKLETAVRAVAIDRAIEWASTWKAIDDTHATTEVNVEGIKCRVTRDDAKCEYTAVVL